MSKSIDRRNVKRYRASADVQGSGNASQATLPDMRASKSSRKISAPVAHDGRVAHLERAETSVLGDNTRSQRDFGASLGEVHASQCKPANKFGHAALSRISNSNNQSNPLSAIKNPHFPTIQRADVNIQENMPPKLRSFILGHPVVEWFDKHSKAPRLSIVLEPMDKSEHGKTVQSPEIIIVKLNSNKIEANESNLGTVMETFTHEIVLHAKSYAKNVMQVRPNGTAPASLAGRRQEQSTLSTLSFGEHNPLLDPDPAQENRQERAKSWRDGVESTLDQIAAVYPEEVAKDFVSEVIRDMSIHSQNKYAQESNPSNQKAFGQKLIDKVENLYRSKSSEKGNK